MGYLGIVIKNLLYFIRHFTFFFIVFRKSLRKFGCREAAGLGAGTVLLFWGAFWGWDSLELLVPIAPSLVIVFAMLYFLFQVSVREMVALALAQWLILSVLEMAMLVILTGMGVNPDEIEDLLVVFVVAGMWGYFFLIGRKLDPQLFQLPIKIWYLLDGIMFILTFMMMFFGHAMLFELPEGKVSRMGEILVILGCCLICVLLFAIIYYFNRTQKFQIQKEIAEQQGNQQKEYFMQLLKKEEETKRFRHDIIAHLTELKYYCDRKDYDSLNRYLTDTLGVIEDISRGGYNVGNDIINTILNSYLQPVKDRCDIEVCGYIDGELAINQTDLCIVVANLVKNAAEAVEQLEHGRIVFRVERGLKYLNIQVVNSFAGELKLDKNKMPKTTKKDGKNHGIGLGNVMEVVRKYEGRYEAETREGEYLVEIFLKS